MRRKYLGKETWSCGAWCPQTCRHSYSGQERETRPPGLQARIIPCPHRVTSLPELPSSFHRFCLLDDYSDFLSFLPSFLPCGKMCCTSERPLVALDSWAPFFPAVFCGRFLPALYWCRFLPALYWCRFLPESSALVSFEQFPAVVSYHQFTAVVSYQQSSAVVSYQNFTAVVSYQQ